MLNLGALGVGALLAAICAWSILQISRSGVVRGRMGGAWSRNTSPAIYWLSQSSLVAGLGAGVWLLAVGLGVAGLVAAGIASATAALTLIAVGRYGRAAERSR